jgi:hypothetical protein
MTDGKNEQHIPISSIQLVRRDEVTTMDDRWHKSVVLGGTRYLLERIPYLTLLLNMIPYLILEIFGFPI